VACVARVAVFHVKHVGDGRRPARQRPGALSVAALTERYGLGEEAERKLGSLLELVVADDSAPTTVRGRPGVLRDHLADSLAALELPEVRSAAAVADLGSGAGFPGLPLAVALAAARVSLVESNGRKSEFIARAAASCSIDNALIVTARAEAWTQGLGSCDLVVARALAPLAVIAEYAAPLLSIGGVLVAWRGRRDAADESSGARAGAELGLEPREPLWVEPYPGALHRHLHPMVKVAATPARFPRRPGMARKRPLGAATREPSDR
jgi:16S rRNA (guanine527-N7)-methyltransferase